MRVTVTREVTKCDECKREYTSRAGGTFCFAEPRLEGDASGADTVRRDFCSDQCIVKYVRRTFEVHGEGCPGTHRVVGAVVQCSIKSPS